MKNNYILAALLIALAGRCVSFAVSPLQASDTESRLTPAEISNNFTTNSTIDDYLNYAFENNPALKKATSAAAAAAARADGSGYLEDPSLSFEYMIEQHDMKYRIGISQMIPGFGKLRLMKKMAGAEAESALHDVEAARLMVYEMVIKVFNNYYYCGRSIEITTEHISLFKELEGTVAAMYKAKAAPYSTLLKVQVEKEKLDDRLKSLRDMRGLLSAKLRFLLGLPGDELLPWPKFQPSESGTLPEDVLMDLLAELNPELKSIDSRIEALEAGAALAKKKSSPDYFFGAGYMVMPKMEDGSEPTDFGLMAGITLPLWFGKNRAAEKEAAFMKEAAQHSRSDLRNELLLELKQALFDLNDADRRIRLFSGTLLPKATQAFEVAKKDFMGGQAGFMTLIDAQRTLLDLRLGLERARADRETALGSIGCCIGKYDFEELNMKGKQ